MLRWVESTFSEFHLFFCESLKLLHLYSFTYILINQIPYTSHWLPSVTWLSLERTSRQHYHCLHSTLTYVASDLFSELKTSCQCLPLWLLGMSVSKTSDSLLIQILCWKLFYLPTFNDSHKKVLVAQSCPTLCDPMDYSPPGSSVHGILQARILAWVAIPISSSSSQPRDQTLVSCVAGRFFTIWATREARP